MKFLNPLGGQVTPLRLLGAILLGSVVPSAALLALRDAAPSTVASAAALVHLPAALAGKLALVALLVISGAVAGCVFGPKHFVGALVVGLMPALVLGRSSLAQPLLALLIIEWTARQTSSWINRRRRLL